MTQETVLDLNVIGELRKLEDPGEPSFVNELIETFFEHAPMVLSQLNASLLTGTAKEVEHYSHKLKGFSRNLGGMALAAYCHEIELRSHSIDQSEVSALQSHLDLLYRNLTQALQTILASSKAA